MNFFKIVSVFIVVTVFTITVVSDKLYAAALCITNPESGLCGVSASISGPSSVNYNTSAGLTLTPGGIFEWYNSKIECAGYTAGDCGLYSRGGYSKTPSNVNVGPLTSPVTVYYSVEDTQGSYASDSLVISINAAPPTATIRFQ